jgi:hypothetical protein
VIQDIRALQVKNWRDVVINREDWLKILKKARVHTGLSSCRRQWTRASSNLFDWPTDRPTKRQWVVR